MTENVEPDAIVEWSPDGKVFIHHLDRMEIAPVEAWAQNERGERIDGITCIEYKPGEFPSVTCINENTGERLVIIIQFPMSDS